MNDESTYAPYRFPLTLDSNIESVELKNGGILRRMSDRDTEEIFGVRFRKDEKGSTSFEITDQEKAPTSFMPESLELLRLAQSNYVFVDPTAGTKADIFDDT